MLKLTLKGHKRSVWSVAFSPVDKCVATGSADMTIRVWALQDGACLRTFEGHAGSVLKARTRVEVRCITSQRRSYI